MQALEVFEVARQQEESLNRLPARLMPIELHRVVGCVDVTRTATLTRTFRPRTGSPSTARYRAIYAAMQRDEPLPPIEVYELHDKYYVVDGHHRVGAARALRYRYLDALVHQFLLPDTGDANRLHNERLHFVRMTGLADVVFTEVGQYRKIADQIREHQFFLGGSGRHVGLIDAAADWHEYVYQPITDLLAGSGVPSHFPERTLSDVYVYLCDYKWIKSQNKGMDIGFPKALADFNSLYPPRRRGIAGHLSLLGAHTGAR